MAKLNFKNGSRFCYSVKEINLKNFYDKAIEISEYNDEEDYIIELRLDYLIGKGVNFTDIIDSINLISKSTDKQLIATIRSFEQSGNCIVDSKTYFSMIELLYNKAKVDAIDIDYCMYEKNKKKYDELLGSKKTNIITYTSFDRIWTRDEYLSLYKTLVKTSADVIKCEIKSYNMDNTKDMMDTAKESIELFSQSKKDVVIIAVGRLGMLSRVMHDYTNTKIVYLTAYEYDSIPHGELDMVHYNKYKKMV